jgi:hypothetical protein
MSTATDATTPRGDGLPERIITDAALWPDARSDVVAVDSPSGDGHVADAGDAAETGADSGASCHLLGATTCPAKQACYPYPFEGASNGDTRCAFAGAGAESIPCQSQLECDGTTLCSAPGLQADSVCLLRCDPAAPRCALGANCVDLPGYPGIGVCR